MTFRPFREAKPRPDYRRDDADQLTRLATGARVLAYAEQQYWPDLQLPKPYRTWVPRGQWAWRWCVENGWSLEQLTAVEAALIARASR